MAGDGTCVFSRVDVKDYQAQLTWIDGIYQKYGRIDMAVYSAGISESMGWIVSADITLESLKEVTLSPFFHFLSLCLLSRAIEADVASGADSTASD